MKVSEQFYTLQGEGKFLGVPSYFIRTTGCNLRCAWRNSDNTTTICDTPHTSWNPEKGETLDTKLVLKELKEKNIKHIVITGGEPTMQRDIIQVIRELAYENVNGIYNMDRGYIFTVETNGTIYVKDLIKGKTFLSFSPKLESSYSQEAGSKEESMHKKNNNFIPVMEKYITEGHRYQVKFVINDEKDLAEILKIQKELHIPSNKIYLMPQGISTTQFKEKEKYMFDICKQYGFNYTPRMHIDIFGNKRGI